MEQQSEELKPKISRCTARHLRRKRLIAARREATKNSSLEVDISDREQEISKPELNKISKPNFKNLNLKSITKVNFDNVDCESVDAISKSDKICNLLEIKNNDVYLPNENKNSLCFDIKLKENSLIQDTKIQIKDTEICELNSSDVLIKTNSLIDINTSSDQNFLSSKMDSQQKSKELVKAEREAKKLAKAAAKTKAKLKENSTNETSIQLNKIDKSKTYAKENLIIVTQENTTTSNECPSKKPSIAQKEFRDKINVDDKLKHEEDKKEMQKPEEKSKAELRAERRAKQEAQRATKQALLAEKKKPSKTFGKKIQDKPIVSVNKEELTKKTIVKSEIKENLHEVNLFKHLYLNRKNISELINRSNINIHPAILRLGVQYAEKVIVGSNARCVALLAAVKQLINDFERPFQADFTRGLEASLQESINYLNFCRPSAVSMQNALKHLKWQMSTLPSTVPDAEAKLKLATAIDTYIQEQIFLADKAISDAIQKKILNGDVILTYGFSSLIHKILCDAYAAGKEFRVVVVDGRPWLEGKELLRRLVKHGIDCSYILINALSFIMPQVSKVFLGAHAILANGAVMSRVGTAQIALMANAFNVPVLIACETHKSCERVQTDSIVYNEIGDPDQLVFNKLTNSKKSCLSNWKTKKTLNLLNITYDVTPADLVTAVVTELAILPCTSVPVILRIKPTEI